MVTLEEWKRDVAEVVKASSRQVGAQSLLESKGREVEIEVVDGSAIWLHVPTEGTSAEGTAFEPFLLDFGNGVWLQGWADGKTLTIASSMGESLVALGLVRAVLGVSTSGVSAASGGAVPDVSELPS